MPIALLWVLHNCGSDSRAAQFIQSPVVSRQSSVVDFSGWENSVIDANEYSPPKTRYNWLFNDISSIADHPIDVFTILDGEHIISIFVAYFLP